MVKKGQLPGPDPRKVGFDVMYRGTPPWDIGRAQREIVKLAESGLIEGDVLDVGCGTGENALSLADRGYKVWGIDSAPKAIAKARQKAKKRNLPATFEVFDALQLGKLKKTFDTVIDSGLFHIFSDEDRARFVKSLAAAVKPGGRYFLFCFSDREPGDWGPRRITKQEIRESFREGWRIDEIREAVFETNFDDPLVHAWLAAIRRV